MNSKRNRTSQVKVRRGHIAAVMVSAAVLLSAGAAHGSPSSGDDGSGSRIAVNGTRTTGIRHPNAGIQGNGTKLTGVRQPNRLAVLPIY